MKYILLAICLRLVQACNNCGQGADGNPHNWDRQRRCDHTDYHPKCQVCEGVGGIPTGDENDEITLTSCTSVANASQIDPATLIKPVWASEWTVINYHEVLIGKKNDPFCFQTFPGNDSAGKLCYRYEYGVQTYDFRHARALREDLIVPTVLGTLQTELLHHGQYMWVVNHFPWYELGIHQCICVQVSGGSYGHQNTSKKAIYPVQKNWTDQLFYVGREKLGVEYIDKVELLDHWAFGPHHVWSRPANGTIVRMWQPFNGLQVFVEPSGTNPGTVDPQKFADIPPSHCKKGGSPFRINCNDTGYYVAPMKDVSSTCSKGASCKATPADLGRARTRKPRDAYRASSFMNMSMTLNKWLTSGSAPVKECSEFDFEELHSLEAVLYLLRDSQLDEVYQKVTDNRRAFNSTLADIQNTWTELQALTMGHKNQTQLVGVIRDSLCHEAVMWYVHHLAEDAKQLLGQSGMHIPLLPYQSHREGDGACVGPADSKTHEQVCQKHEETVTCLSCHSDVSR